MIVLTTNYKDVIARRLGVSRNTVAKYIAVLVAEGRIECRTVGKAKLCRARER